MEIFLLKPGTPKLLIYTAYYLLMILILLISSWLIFEGISDPFGQFLTFLGIVLLLLGPILLRIVFGFLLRDFKTEATNSLSR